MKTSSISKAESDEEMGDFWDTHDFTEFDTDTVDAEFEVISAQGCLRSHHFHSPTSTNGAQ